MFAGRVNDAAALMANSRTIARISDGCSRLFAAGPFSLQTPIYSQLGLRAAGALLRADSAIDLPSRNRPALECGCPRRGRARPFRLSVHILAIAKARR
jgi:hypothetical protein